MAAIVPEVENPDIREFIQSLGPFLNHISESDIHQVQPIGAGGQGNVYLGKIRYMGWCAIKKLLAVPSLRGDTSLSALRELVNSYQMSFNPHIVRFYGFAYSRDGPQSIIMEPMEGGDLHRYLHSNEEISEKSKVTYALHLARAIGSMHHQGRIHRDIKPANVFLNADKTFAKLGDFGYSKALEPVNTTRRGTFHYMAPEMMVGEDAVAYGAEVDVYSYGMTLFHIFTREVPFASEGVPLIQNPMNFRRRILGLLEGVPSRPEFPVEPQIPDYFRDLITRCWAQDNRPSMADICSELENYAETNDLLEA